MAAEVVLYNPGYVPVPVSAPVRVKPKRASKKLFVGLVLLYTTGWLGAFLLGDGMAGNVAMVIMVDMLAGWAIALVLGKRRAGVNVLALLVSVPLFFAAVLGLAWFLT